MGMRGNKGEEERGSRWKGICEGELRCCEERGCEKEVLGVEDVGRGVCQVCGI